jgi:hypothetical protein
MGYLMIFLKIGKFTTISNLLVDKQVIYEYNVTKSEKKGSEIMMLTKGVKLALLFFLIIAVGCNETETAKNEDSENTPNENEPQDETESDDETENPPSSETEDNSSDEETVQNNEEDNVQPNGSDEIDNDDDSEGSSDTENQDNNSNQDQNQTDDNSTTSDSHSENTPTSSDENNLLHDYLIPISDRDDPVYIASIYYNLPSSTQQKVANELTKQGFDMDLLENADRPINQSEATVVFDAIIKVKNEQNYNWFELDEMQVHYYSGAVEYAHQAYLVGFDMDSTTKEGYLKQEIHIQDMSGQQNDRFFYIQHVFRDGEIYQERIDSAEGPIDPFPFGIAPHRMILPSNVVLGETWSEDVEINGQMYTIHSEITKIEPKKVFVESYIDGISGYANNRYEEQYTIEKNLGISLHTHSMPDPINFDFGFQYYQSGPLN